MPPTTHLPPLPKSKRRIIFWLTLFLFLLAVPLMVLYAVGYRFDFSGDIYNLKAVGGLYINSTATGARIIVDDEPVQNMRIFRNAAYIQDLEAGVHEVYVESDGLQTWVKELPVFAHLVTEAQSFNLPYVPQVRLLSPWLNETNINFFLKDQPIKTDFEFASITNPYFLATSSIATSSLNENLEYAYIKNQFASSSIELALLTQWERIKAEPFVFLSEGETLATTSATTTKRYRDLLLYKHEEEVYVTWLGSENDAPYYFCLTNEGPELTKKLYGQHVYEQLTEQMASVIATEKELTLEERFCRHTIKIDRLRQKVQWFDFLPGNENLVLMLLEDGLYVVEIDDRPWQNTQLLYPGRDLEVLLDSGRIFVHDRDYYLEVFTEIIQP